MFPLKITAFTLVLVLFSHSSEQSQSYEDARCKCICTVVNGTQIYKKLYVSSVPSDNDCDAIALPASVAEENNKTEELCPRCTCKYESRNTAVIKIVVIMVVWIISLLLVYMLFLVCMDPVFRRKLRGHHYTEHTNEEVCSLMDDYDEKCEEPGRNIQVGSVDENTQEMSIRTISGTSGAASTVLNRVGYQQDKWRKRVQEQRKNIYDRHTMLN